MPRSFTVIGWMTLGALACGGGLGYYLHQANTDRQFLSLRVHALEEQMAQAKSDNNRLTAAADKATQDAAAAVAKIQQQIQTCQEEHQHLVQAVPLTKPDYRVLRTWQQALSVPLGISLQLPPDTVVAEYDNRLDASAPHNPSSTSLPWLSIQSYDQNEEYRLDQGLVDTTRVDYLVAGRLVTGLRGRNQNLPGTIYVLRILSPGTPTHLIWARAENDKTDAKIQQSLSTLALR